MSTDYDEKLPNSDEEVDVTLLPEARVVTQDELLRHNNPYPDTTTLPVLEAQPIISDDVEQRLQQTVPLMDSHEGNIYPNYEHADAEYRAGTFRGRQEAAREREAVAQFRRDAHAYNREQQRVVDIANQHAMLRKMAEDHGKTQTTTTAAAAQTLANALAPPTGQKPQQQSEFYAGTYGKAYEVEEYQTSDYNTTDYDVNEYKSVYEP